MDSTEKDSVVPNERLRTHKSSDAAVVTLSEEDNASTPNNVQTIVTAPTMTVDPATVDIDAVEKTIPVEDFEEDDGVTLAIEQIAESKVVGAATSSKDEMKPDDDIIIDDDRANEGEQNGEPDVNLDIIGDDDDGGVAVADIAVGAQQREQEASQPLSVGKLGEKLFGAGAQIGAMELSKLQTSYMINQQAWPFPNPDLTLLCTNLT